MWEGSIETEALQLLLYFDKVEDGSSNLNTPPGHSDSYQLEWERETCLLVQTRV